MTHYLIVGTSVAGIAAAETIRAHDPQGEITLVGEEPDGYYSRPGLAYLLTGEIPEYQLYPFQEKDFRRLKLTRLIDRAVQIDRPGRLLLLASGQNLPYDKLLLATGSYATSPQVPGLDLPGVVQLDNISDARTILSRAGRGKTAVVVGGGITALEIVEGLHARGVRVLYFLRGDRYWSNVLDEVESRIVENQLKHEGVELLFNTDLDEILGSPSGRLRRGPPAVSGVRTKAGEIIACQIVGMAIGILARVELAKAAGLPVDKGILANEYMQTEDPDIYTAGNAAQVHDPRVGKALLDSLWPIARDQGRTAGANMVSAGKPSAGAGKPFLKDVPFNVTRLAGLTTTIIGSVGTGGRDGDRIGIARSESESWYEIPEAIASQSGFDVNHIRLMVAEKHLAGAIVMGDQTLSRPIYELVKNKVDIGVIRESLLRPDAPVAEIVAGFWVSQR